MIKREKLTRHPRTIWRIWTCDVTPTSRMEKLLLWFIYYWPLLFVYDNCLHPCWPWQLIWIYDCDFDWKMLCKFFKVVAGRATKSSNWPDLALELEGPFAGNIPTSVRYDRYTEIFQGQEHMIVPYAYFEKSLRKIEKNLTKETSKGNICKNYNAVSWNNLTESEKLEHSVHDCKGCCMYICALSLLFPVLTSKCIDSKNWLYCIFIVYLLLRFFNTMRDARWGDEIFAHTRKP